MKTTSNSRRARLRDKIMNKSPEARVRELDRRTNDGIDVMLLWNSHTGRVSVAVEDARRVESFEFEVDPSQALAAFFHPYAHAPGDHTHRPIGPSGHRAIGPSGHRAIGPSGHRAIDTVTRRPDNTAPRECIDLDAEGLLDGVHGSARAARRRLLNELLEDGATLGELREAVALDRVALLPSERLLYTGDHHIPRYTAEEVAERAGVSVDDLRFTGSALGLPLAGPGRRVHTEVDVELGRQLATALAAGLSVGAVAEVDRAIARGITQIVAASRTAVLEATLRPGMTEREAARAWASAARQLVPNATRRIVLASEAHLRKAIEHEDIGAADTVAGKSTRTRPVSLAFADLVGFTRLGELLSPEDLGRGGRRLDETATSFVRPPTIVAKTIGDDAVMLASPDPGDLLQTTIALIAYAAPLEGFPPVRAGVAHGDVHERDREWYGEIVNLASRITRATPAGVVVATDVVREQIPHGFRRTAFVPGELKGVQRRPRLYTVTSKAAVALGRKTKARDSLGRGGSGVVDTRNPAGVSNTGI